MTNFMDRSDNLIYNNSICDDPETDSTTDAAGAGVTTQPVSEIE